ncbi:hypothetical protein CEXT_298611 [Caerostris extrusa]|uniref:Uncharacterized protein n=1 Tax=Caerostris extrusa TaxID=172846 RepID=A0AAV4UTP1_CAEEX|nr:hypothetical protein CEXT_298611 [Caerostris extrusa]
MFKENIFARKASQMSIYHSGERVQYLIPSANYGETTFEPGELIIINEDRSFFYDQRSLPLKGRKLFLSCHRFRMPPRGRDESFLDYHATMHLQFKADSFMMSSSSKVILKPT